MGRLLSFLSSFLFGALLLGLGAAMGVAASNEDSLLRQALAHQKLWERALVAGPEAPVDAVLDEGQFGYYAPGNLLPRTGSGALRKGVEDWTLYAETMRFPVKAPHPAFLNSQIYNPGGGRYLGPDTNNQCASANYTYPWRDNFCEGRWGTDRDTLNCPSRSIHQGVDIRGGTGGRNGSTCYRMAWGGEKTLVPVVAAEAGRVEYSKLPYKYVVMIITDEGRVFRYLHLDQTSLKFEPGTRVEEGTVLGYLSNDFGRTSTTHHLHFEIAQNVDGRGFTYVSPYMSLVRAYERDQGLDAVLVE